MKLLSHVQEFTVKVIANASKNQVIELSPSELKVKLTAPPVDGKANALLVKVLSKYFSISPSKIEIVSGEFSKKKRVRLG